jgi:hypothetical protein
MSVQGEAVTMESLKYYVPGILLILMAMMIVAFPEILVALVAASIIVAGVGALCVGHVLRKTHMGFRNAMRGTFHEDPYGEPFQGRPRSGWWHGDDQ